MISTITIFRRIGAPWYKVQAQTPFNFDYKTVAELEVYCLGLAKADDVSQITAFDFSGKMLVDLYKSERKPVIIYNRSKYPRE